jgi:hypothetical protein
MRECTVMPDDGADPEAQSAGAQLLQATRKWEAEQRARETLEAAIATGFADGRLHNVLGTEQANTLLAARNDAETVCEVWRRIIDYRDKTHAVLRQLTDQIAQIDTALEGAKGVEGPEDNSVNMWCVFLAAQREAHTRDAGRIACTIEEFDRSLTSMFSNAPALKRAQKLIEEHERGGLSFDGTRGKLGQRLLEEAVSRAYDAALPIVKALHEQLKTCPNRSARQSIIANEGFETRLRKWLTPEHEGQLEFAAVAIDLARMNAASSPVAALTQRGDGPLPALLGVLQTRPFQERLTARGSSDVEHGNNGPAKACLWLVEHMTGIAAETVRDHLRRVRSRQEPRKSDSGRAPIQDPSEQASGPDVDLVGASPHSKSNQRRRADRRPAPRATANAGRGKRRARRVDRA